MELLEKLSGRKPDRVSGKVFKSIVGRLKTPKGTITQYLDPETGTVYSTEFSNAAIQAEADIRGVGSDCTIGEDGKIAKVHTRFERTADNPHNHPRIKPIAKLMP